ncbi:unnamed protein product, partial [Rotaria sp. Silwood1]
NLEAMPVGQTPITVTIVAHNDLVDAVQPGDRSSDIHHVPHNIASEHSVFKSITTGKRE